MKALPHAHLPSTCRYSTTRMRLRSLFEVTSGDCEATRNLPIDKQVFAHEDITANKMHNLVASAFSYPYDLPRKEVLSSLRGTRSQR